MVAGIAEANNADPAGTLGLGSLARLRDEGRQAKERLSAETATVVPAELPGFNSDIRVTRNELENLISEPLAGLLTTIEETLQRNNIPVADMSAVATVGGGANIPLVTQQLSERLRAPVVTTPQSQLNVAAGAALVADAVWTRMRRPGWPRPRMRRRAWPPRAGPRGPRVWPRRSRRPTAPPRRRSGRWRGRRTIRPAASRCRTPARTTPSIRVPPTPGQQVAFAHEEEGYEPEPGPLPWYKRPPILFGAAAAAALLAVGGLAVTLTGTSGRLRPGDRDGHHLSRNRHRRDRPHRRRRPR